MEEEEKVIGYTILDLEVSNEPVIGDTSYDSPPVSSLVNAINTFALDIHENAKNHGWYDEESIRCFGELIALCHAELSEALEEYRKGKNYTETYYNEEGKPEGIPSELADVIIRILDMCAYYGIDIGGILEEKHKFNKTRPYRHGNKVI